MDLEVDGRVVRVGSGGGERGRTRPLIVFLHGAGMDHSVWALQSRWFAHHGFDVAAVDFPGHGGSAGPPLADIGAMAEWTARLIASAGAERAALVGHSMGALVALETAGRHPSRVANLGLIGVAETMPVHPDLLAAAAANSPDAIAMVSLWSLGVPATRGGNPTPGLWMLGGTERLLERAAPGVLRNALAACDSYAGANAAAERVACPTTLVLGERDQMTPAKSGRALAERIRGARVVAIPGAGHMLMSERPDEVLAALRAGVGVA
jgi:pimeloyl-ACP methyl ester carboxylesterase